MNTNETPNLLPCCFKRDQFHCRLVARTDDWALLAKTKPARVQPTFEVVRIRHQPAAVLPSGKSYPPREAMPPDEDWGTNGWSRNDWARALDLFAEKLSGASVPVANVTWYWPADPQSPPTNAWVLDHSPAGMTSLQAPAVVS